MGDIEQTSPELSTVLPRWDHDLLDRCFPVIEERPPLSGAARALEIKENLKRHKTYSTDYSGRGRWQKKPDTAA